MPTSSNNEFTTSRGWTNKCRRNNRFPGIFVISIVLVLGSMFACIPYKTIDFQIMRPANIKLGNIDRVDIHCEFCADSSLIQELDPENQNNARVSLNFIYTLKETLQKSPLLQNSQFSILSSDSLLLILKDYNSRINSNGIVIVLDSIYLRDTTILQPVRGFYYPAYVFGMIHKFGCRTYNLNNMQIIDNYILEDTLFWPPHFSEAEHLLYSPSISEAIWDAGIIAGEKYAHYLAPYWIDQSRIFYTGNTKSFNNAFTLIQQNQLDSALKVLDPGDKVIRSKLRKSKLLNNKAVIHELQDDLNNALILIDSSINIKKDILSEEYAEKLRLRKIDKTALDWQLNQ